ncbi:MAG: ribose-phosphate diphosphokinase [Bacilli bacterium]|nr:ribose-phosphate diphosphokinase [Bacilli bacterium]
MNGRKLKLLVMPNCYELGEKVDKELKKLNKTEENFLIDFKPDRFSNGEGKVRINENVNNTDLYILSDVGNYDITYNYHGRDHHMAPDEHFEDIKRSIGAISGHAAKINVVMPLLYESRQHKRRGNESLDCAISLQELESMGVKNIITFDAHDPSICNAIPRLQFENFYPTHRILEEIIDKEEIKDLLVISPDMGAMERARYYADMLGVDVGVFYKRRDLSKVVNGKNPIVEHMYMGANPEGKDVMIVDDMIASGGSILEVAKSLKEKGVGKIYLIATFSLFTEGIDNFNEAYENKLFHKIYSTNLTYVPEEIKEKEWYQDVDCSRYLAKIINTFNKHGDIEELWNGKKKIINKIKKKKEEEEKQLQLDI